MEKKYSIFGLILVILIGSISAANAQYTSISNLSHPGNPNNTNTLSDYNTTTKALPPGVTALFSFKTAKAFAPKYSAVQTIPFTFDFNGGPVTSFLVSSTGYITFSTTTKKIAGTTNSALPSSALPDSSITCWGLGETSKGFGQVYTRTCGIPPNQQLWISYWGAGNPSDSNSMNFWSIVLEAQTNNIYIVDQWGLNNTVVAGTYHPINITAGVQINSTTAYEIAGSPNINSLTTSPALSDNDYYEFTPNPLPAYDASVVSSNINNKRYFGVGVPYTVTGDVANLGTTTLTSFNLNWEVTSATDNIDKVSGVSIASTPSVGHDSVIHTIKWTPAATGTYTMKIWADSLNGNNVDQNPTNDTLTIVNIGVIDSVAPKMVVLEEFTSASSDSCLSNAENLDTVIANNPTICAPIRYHVSWPDTDYMNRETDGPFVSSRVSYYGIASLPGSKLDGNVSINALSINSGEIQNEASIGSPMLIQINSCTYDNSTDTYSLNAKITSYESMATGLIAHAVLTVDTMKYVADQSIEDPSSDFGSSAKYPASWEQYALNFPNVAEDMLPSVSGTTLSAFTAGQSQIINVSWGKNHPWGANPKVHSYDSVGVHMTVFVQNKITQYIYQAATAVPATLTSVNESSNNSNSIQVYPNPFSNQTHVIYNLSSTQNVTMELWNVMGQKVGDIYNGQQTSGQHEMVINKDNLQAGMYFLRLITDKGVTVQKIVIQ